MNSNDNKPTGDILITGRDNFLVNYMVKEFNDHVPDTVNVLRLSSGTDMSLTVPAFSRPIHTVVHIDETDDDRHHNPVSRDAVINLCKSLESKPPREMVYISSTAVYGREEGDGYDESTSAAPVTPYAKSKLEIEKMLTDWCRSHNVTLTILRPALIVGTGMMGVLRETVNSIYRGTYRLIKDNEARRSVIHAVDVARAARIAAPQGGIYNLTDLADPTVNDLAEALAYRISNKRIYALDIRRARKVARFCDWIPLLPLNTRRLRQLTTSLTFDGRTFCHKFDFTPVSVTDYLHNHVYDENSL